MEHGFYHPERGYWQTNSDVPQSILDTYPDGTVEVPLRPGPDYEWTGSDWAHVPPDPTEALTQWRETTTAPFADFLVALFDADWITEAEFNDWLSRNALPADVQSLIDGLSNSGERVRARRYALGAQVFERLHPLLLQIAEVKRQALDPQPTEDDMALAVDEVFRAATGEAE